MNEPLFTSLSEYSESMRFFVGHDSTQELLRLDAQGMIYKGQRIDDAGEAYKAWMEAMSLIQNFYAKPKSSHRWVVAFTSPWDNGVFIKFASYNATSWKEAFKEAVPGFFSYVEDLHDDIEIAKKQAYPNGHNGQYPFEFEVTEII
jgi:hypothetical protein